jgi:hypothetical protein
LSSLIGWNPHQKWWGFFIAQQLLLAQLKQQLVQQHLR